MKTQDAYNNWAVTYDTTVNKTRDLEAKAIRQVLENYTFNSILEIGCGTGKNTTWLADKSNHLTAIDFSEEMLQIARQKVTSENVHFEQADITKTWLFSKADLVTCSLVLEHIQNIKFIFQQAAVILNGNGKFYLCELHPYKQLSGSRARFEKEGNLLELEYFIHHISDYLEAAKQHGFTCADLQEWFDDNDKTQPPRLISFLFHRK
ncbi:MAG: class I SAM-dependent methyltransferase [Ginsengibacter sp.]